MSNRPQAAQVVPLPLKKPPQLRAEQYLAALLARQATKACGPCNHRELPDKLERVVQAKGVQ